MDSNPKVILNDGCQMPLIGLGMLNFKPNDKTFNLTDFVLKAANIGYTHFDVTNNQQLIGDAIRNLFQQKRQLENQEGEKINEYEYLYPRDQIFISYKVYNTANIQKDVTTALSTMKLQYFDLVMLNCPMAPPPPSAAPTSNQDDPADPPPQQKQPIKKQSMIKGWQIMENLKQKGLCKTIGVSNFTVQAILNLAPFVKIKPTVNQIECHPYLIQKNMHNICLKLKIAMIAYCPLMRGGKDQKQPLGDKIDYQSQGSLKQIASKYAKTVPQIILNYQICRGVAVIPKTEKLEHLMQNFSITDFELHSSDITELEKLDRIGKSKVYQLKMTPIWKGEDPLC